MRKDQQEDLYKKIIEKQLHAKVLSDSKIKERKDKALTYNRKNSAFIKGILSKR